MLNQTTSQLLCSHLRETLEKNGLYSILTESADNIKFISQSIERIRHSVDPAGDIAHFKEMLNKKCKSSAEKIGITYDKKLGGRFILHKPMHWQNSYLNIFLAGCRKAVISLYMHNGEKLAPHHIMITCFKLLLDNYYMWARDESSNTTVLVKDWDYIVKQLSDKIIKMTTEDFYKLLDVYNVDSTPLGLDEANADIISKLNYARKPHSAEDLLQLRQGVKSQGEWIKRIQANYNCGRRTAYNYLKKFNVGLREYVTTVNNDTTDDTTVITAESSEIEKLKEQIAALEKENNDLKQQIANLKEDYEAQIEGLNTLLDDKYQTIADLQIAVNESKKACENLKNENVEKEINKLDNATTSFFGGDCEMRVSPIGMGGINIGSQLSQLNPLANLCTRITFDGLDAAKLAN